MNRAILLPVAGKATEPKDRIEGHGEFTLPPWVKPEDVERLIREAEEERARQRQEH